MEAQSGVDCQGGHKILEALLERTLLLDLEVSLSGQLLKVGAAVDDSTLAAPGNCPLSAALAALSELAAQADCLLGHNLVRHDLRILRERAPSLAVHKLPASSIL